MSIKVFSEIGKLRSVILHRPGKELDNLVPDSLEELLFDDIPFLKQAVKEHDNFARIFKEQGVEVLYIEDLMTDVIKDKKVKDEFLREFLDESDLHTNDVRDVFSDYLNSIEDEKSMILKTMEGTRVTELKDIISNKLYNLLYQDTLFIAKPMPNLYFTRDPFSLIGNGVSINKMWSVTRNRETIYGKYIFNNHPRFKNENTKFWYDREYKDSIEGGDQLVLSNKVLAVGVSQRTNMFAIEKLARNMFGKSSFEIILVIKIPEKRAFMHLDTVFTMIDRNLFTIHPEIKKPLEVFELSKNSDGSIKVASIEDKLENILAHYLEVDKVDFIYCGNNDMIDAAREQWSDGSNTLAIAPREVIVYDRNEVTNRALKEYGVKLHEVSSSELARGRGGPRCMSMPLIRDDL